MNLNEEVLKAIRAKLDTSDLIRHCLNCEYHNEQDDVVTCTLYPGSSQPPARILIYGCASWMANIPF